MRKLCLVAALCSPVVHAEVVSVAANSMMRLPANVSVLRLEKLDVADYGTLLIPAGVTQVNIDQLHLGREARITLVPAEQGIELRVARAELDEGSQINARGATGTFEKPARPARNLSLRIESLQAPQLSIDARTGRVGKFTFQQMRRADAEFDHLQPALNVALGVGNRLAMLAR